MKGLQKVMRWFLDADNNPEIPTKSQLLLFGPFTMFLEICMQINSVVFALNRQINKQKYAKTINLLCAGCIVFVRYQAQGRLTPTPPPLAYAFGPQTLKTYLELLTSMDFTRSIN